MLSAAAVIEMAGTLPRCDAGGLRSKPQHPSRPAKRRARRSVNAHSPGRALPLTQLDSDSNLRMSSGMSELDRVLGGGLVRGSAVLLSGEPGIGKSTLLLQISNSLATERRVLYISGEESPGQIRLSAERLGAVKLYVLAETSLENALGRVDAISPEVSPTRFKRFGQATPSPRRAVSLRCVSAPRGLSHWQNHEASRL